MKSANWFHQPNCLFGSEQSGPEASHSGLRQVTVRNPLLCYPAQTQNSKGLANRTGSGVGSEPESRERSLFKQKVALGSEPTGQTSKRQQLLFTRHHELSGYNTHQSIINNLMGVLNEPAVPLLCLKASWVMQFFTCPLNHLFPSGKKKQEFFISVFLLVTPTLF